MSICEHRLRMALGFFLYWTLMRLPGAWWVTDRGWLHFLLPHLGYYCHQPSEYGWRRPVLLESEERA